MSRAIIRNRMKQKREIARARAGWLWTSTSGLIHIGRNDWNNSYCGVKVGLHGRYTADVAGQRNRIGEHPCFRCLAILRRARRAEDEMLTDYGFRTLMRPVELKVVGQ